MAPAPHSVEKLIFHSNFPAHPYFSDVFPPHCFDAKTPFETGPLLPRFLSESLHSETCPYVMPMRVLPRRRLLLRSCSRPTRGAHEPQAAANTTSRYVTSPSGERLFSVAVWAATRLKLNHGCVCVFACVCVCVCACMGLNLRCAHVHILMCVGFLLQDESTHSVCVCVCVCNLFNFSSFHPTVPLHLL